ncbi:hypothetical protein [Streptomyces sp. NPDC048442]|uniref:hypothetical protein n=1 Tax=Streptomyces sp. NPDC048442 TaxID=3154823 RepID=UPI00341BA04F
MPHTPPVLAGLDAIGWGSLSHSYGSAADVPGHVRDVLVPGRAEDAVDELSMSVHHQGGHICPAAPPLLPFLVGLAADPAVTVRAELLDLIGSLAQAGAESEERFVDPGWGAAWEQAVPLLLGLLADPDPAVRRGCLFPLSYGGARTAEELWAALEREEDPATRFALLDALTELALQHPQEASSVRRLREAALGARAPLERLAAAVGVRRAASDGPDPELTAVVAQSLRDMDLGVLAEEVGATWGFGDPAGLVPWAVDAFGADREGRIVLVRGLLASPDAKRRAGALRSAAAVLGRWRSAAPALLPEVAGLLADEDPANRRFAARVLGMCGEAARPWADGLAGLAGADGPAGAAGPGGSVSRWSAGRSRLFGGVARARAAPSHDEETRQARNTALWALARLGDVRAVGPLAARLPKGRTGFATHQTYADGWALHDLSLLEVLGPLSGHSAALLPALRRALAAAKGLDERRTLCQVLGEWGPSAAPAIPELAALLGTRAAVWALQALAAIGPEAAAALDPARLRALAQAPATDHFVPRELGLAYWRLTGDPGPALDVLLPDLEERYVHHAPAEFLAELGPGAAPYLDRLRAALPAYSESWLPMTIGYALWRITGESEEAVPLVLGALGPLSEPGRSADPAMTVAVRHLTEIGPEAVRQAGPVLERLVAADERPVRHGNWRSVPDDDALRAAALAALNTLPERVTSRPPTA